MKFKDRGTSSKNFLRLKAGESVRGVFRGEPYDFKQHWIDNRGVLCVGGECPVCKEGKKPAFRFRLNFVMNENGAYVAKIFEQGWTVYDYLRSLHGADYDLEKTLVKITRHGSGTDTTYAIVPLPNGTITDEIEKKLATVKLNELENPGDASDAAEPEADGDGVPF